MRQIKQYLLKKSFNYKNFDERISGKVFIGTIRISRHRIIDCNLYRKSHDLEYNSWLIGTSDFESSQNCTSLEASAIWEFSKSLVPVIHEFELYEKVVWLFI